MIVRGLGLVTLGLAWACGLQAQGRPIQVRTQANLNFGAVFAGVSTRVAPFPGGGEFEIRGARGAQVLIQLALPGALSGPGGSAPLSYGTSDGAHGPNPSSIGLLTFDPRLPLTVVMPSGQVYYVWIGGTVSPPAALTPGTYSATIVLTASYL